MTQRHRYSEWVKLIEEFEKTGSSLEDFAAKLGVKPSPLGCWRGERVASYCKRSFGCPSSTEFDGTR